MNLIDVHNEIADVVKDLPDYNYILGRTLMQPYRPANSGSRALMNSVHTEQLMPLDHAEVPIAATGMENQFGETSTSYISSKGDIVIIAKIYKYSNTPEHYVLITRDINTGEYGVIFRTPYNHNTESYGYLFNNDKIDRKEVGSGFKTGDIIKTSIGYDEYGNKMNGVNLVTMYLSSGQNMEDSVILSESAASKMSSSLINSNSTSLNDNDVLLNLYGDENVYKTFPDIGEHVKNGVFCSIRRVENDNILFTMSQANLREMMLSDRNILMDGKVVDIQVYCNNPEALGDSHYNGQLLYYYNENLRFCKAINDLVGPIAMNNKLSYDLEKLYSTCRDIVAGKQFYKEKLFNHVIINVTVVESKPMCPGDKMCDRYGGKGVVSKILPDEMMPLLDNGVRVECIKNQSTCINRENLGQLHEQSLTFIGMRLIDYFKMGALTYTEMAQIYYDYISCIDDSLAEFILSAFNTQDEYEAKLFMQTIIDDGAIIFSDMPFTTRINIDTIAEMYEKFPYITQYRVKVPIIDSNGNIRMTNTLRRMVVGKIYNYRLKQYAEEKFSVTSLSATNLKNLNTRSKANKQHEAKFPKTPIMFGFMESGDMMHLGAEYVVMNLMLYSSSPGARRLFEQLLIGDPYNIDIKLDDSSKNRNAEIINALMETMGVKLVFRKHLKKPKVMCTNIMCKVVPPRLLGQAQTDLIQNYQFKDHLEMQYRAALQDKEAKQMVTRVMCRIVEDDKNASNIECDIE